MKVLGLTVTLEAPALLTATPPASNLTETLPYIPGNTIRGILARRYLDTVGGAEDADFQRLFMSGTVRFGFAYVQGAQPLPLSARSCKYDSGFIKNDGHGMQDLLLVGSEEVVCGYCLHSIDYAAGYWEPLRWRRATVTTRLITRTAIDPARGTARTGQLFSQRVLEERQTFYAPLEAPDALAPVLEKLLQTTYTARLGRGSSRGQGWATVQNVEAEPLPWGTARERFQQFQLHNGKPRLVVTLLSDALLRDNYLRDVTAPTSADLAPLGIDPAEWQSAPNPEHVFMDTHVIFGFDGAPLSLPRQPRLAVAAGSAFLFEAKDPARLPTIPAGNGYGWIGENTGEGYGRAILWHPFHLTP